MSRIIRVLSITLAILVLWAAAEFILYSLQGGGTVLFLASLGLAFVVGAIFFRVIKRTWKK